MGTGVTVACWTKWLPSRPRLMYEPCQLLPAHSSFHRWSKNSGRCRSLRTTAAGVRPATSLRRYPVRRSQARFTKTRRPSASVSSKGTSMVARARPSGR